MINYPTSINVEKGRVNRGVNGLANHAVSPGARWSWDISSVDRPPAHLYGVFRVCFVAMLSLTVRRCEPPHFPRHECKHGLFASCSRTRALPNLGFVNLICSVTKSGGSQMGTVQKLFQTNPESTQDQPSLRKSSCKLLKFFGEFDAD